MSAWLLTSMAHINTLTEYFLCFYWYIVRNISIGLSNLDQSFIVQLKSVLILNKFSLTLSDY